MRRLYRIERTEPGTGRRRLRYVYAVSGEQALELAGGNGWRRPAIAVPVEPPKLSA